MGDLDFEAVEKLMEKGRRESEGRSSEGGASPKGNGNPRRSGDSEGFHDRRSRERDPSPDGSGRGDDGSPGRRAPHRGESPECRKARRDSPGATRVSRGRGSPERRKGGAPPRGESPEPRRGPRGLSPESRRGPRGNSPDGRREGRRGPRSPSPRRLRRDRSPFRRMGGWREGPWPRGAPRGRDLRHRGSGGPFRRGFGGGDDFGRRGGGPDFRRKDRDFWPPPSRRSRSRDRMRRGDPRGASPSPGRRGGGALLSAPAHPTPGVPGEAPTGVPPARMGPREELLRRKREEEMRRKEVEEARRDDLTVLVLNLSLKADERHIYEFFSANAGKIRDIQQIRDQRSGVSKGVAYVEFYTQEAVIKAMALNGIAFKGQPLRVQASMAEKNRAARAAKCPTAPAPDASSLQIPMRVYVGGLTGSLASLTREDLLALFSPFGSIQEVVLPTDPNTGESVGFAFVMFSCTGDAHDAMQQMHRTKINGQELRVGYAADGVRLSGSFPEAPPATPPGGLHQVGGGSGIPSHVVASTQVSYEAQLAKQLAAQAANMMKQHLPQGQQEGAPQQQEGEDEGGIDDDDVGYIHDPSRKQALMQKLMDRSSAALVPGSAPSTSSGGSDDVQHHEHQHTSTAEKQQFLPSSSGSRVGGLAPGVITSNLMLRGMFNPSAAEDEYYFDDIREDVKEECGKHGSVVQVSLSEKDDEGRVFVKFTAPSVALAAKNALNGRFFGGRQIHAEFATDAMIGTVCGTSTSS